MAKELDKKVIFLVEVIDIVMDASIPKVKFYTRSILEFDKNYKNIQMRAKRLKKILKKKA